MHAHRCQREKPAGCIFMISLIFSAEIKIVENSLIGVPGGDDGILFNNTTNNCENLLKNDFLSISFHLAKYTRIQYSFCREGKINLNYKNAI